MNGLKKFKSIKINIINELFKTFKGEGCMCNGYKARSGIANEAVSKKDHSVCMNKNCSHDQSKPHICNISNLFSQIYV